MHHSAPERQVDEDAGKANMAPTGESDPGELDNLAKDSEEQREYQQ